MEKNKKKIVKKSTPKASTPKIKKETTDPNQLRLLYFKTGGCSMGATFLAILANNMIVMAAEMLMTL